MKATLTYHSIDGSGSAISVSPHDFDTHLRWLTGGGIRVSSLDDLVTHRDEPGDTVAVTFDDGFANTKPAIERLLDHGITPTVFVVTAQAGGTNAWGGRPQAGIPTLPLLGWKDLEALAARGARFEAHTRTHPRLTRVSSAELDDEVGGCQEDLRVRLGVKSRHLAYPFGDVNIQVAARAGASFAFGHTVEMRALSGVDEALRLPRLDMYYYRRPGTIEGWGGPSFARRLFLIRLRRQIRNLILR